MHNMVMTRTKSNLLLMLVSSLPAVYGATIGFLQLGEGGFDRSLFVAGAFLAVPVILLIGWIVRRLFKKSKYNHLIALCFTLAVSLATIVYLYNIYPPTRY